MSPISSRVKPIFGLDTHISDLIADYKTSWSSRSFTDVTFRISGKSIVAHQFYLSLYSPFLKELFESQVVCCGRQLLDPIIILDDDGNENSFEALEILFGFLYQGHISVSNSFILESLQNWILRLGFKIPSDVFSQIFNDKKKEKNTEKNKGEKEEKDTKGKGDSKGFSSSRNDKENESEETLEFDDDDNEYNTENEFISKERYGDFPEIIIEDPPLNSSLASINHRETLPLTSPPSSSFLMNSPSLSSPYPCRYCPTPHYSKLTFTSHILSHFEDGVLSRQTFDSLSPCQSYDCHLCSRSCETKKSFLYHVGIEHEFLKDLIDEETSSLIFGVSDFPCSLCPESFPSQKTHKLHMTFTHAGSKVDKTCSECGKTFNSVKYLTRHIQFRHVKIPQSLKERTCSHCGKVSKTLNALSLHVSFHHGDSNYSSRLSYPSESLTCSFCKKTCKTKLGLDRHILYVHTRGGNGGKSLSNAKYICTHCSRGFSLSSRLDRHVSRDHGILPAPATCPECSKVFKSRTGLVSHFHFKHSVSSLSSHYEDLFICSLCMKSFSSQGELGSHVKFVHRREHACTLCPQICVSKTMLLYHMAVKHYKNKIFSDLLKVNESLEKCHLCHKAFKTPANYKNRIAILYHYAIRHDIIQNYVCSELSSKRSLLQEENDEQSQEYDEEEDDEYIEDENKDEEFYKTKSSDEDFPNDSFSSNQTHSSSSPNKDID